jgi:hypothetical protein
MRKIFKLAATLLKSGGLFVSDNSKKKSRNRWLVPVMLGFAFLSFAFSVGAMTMGMYDTLAPLGQANALIPLAFGATSAVIFLFGIFYVVSVMYHADDIPQLLYLPLKPYQILGAKFLTLVVYEYIFESFILIPMLVAYGIKAAAGPLFIAYSVVLALATPVIALSMAAVIIMLVMRFTRFAKNKQAFNYVSGILALILAIGFNILLQTNIRSMMEHPESITSLAPIVSNIFPGAVFAGNALIASETWTGLLNLLLFLVCSGAAIAVFLLLGQLLYFKGVAGVTETSAKRKAYSAESLTRETAGAPVLWSYTKKEIRLLVRSPIAFMNCVLMNFIWPLVLLLMLFTGSESMTAVKTAVSGIESPAVIAILVGMAAFVSSGNAVTSSAISREGKGIYFMKYVPMSIKRQLAAKTLAGVLLSGTGIVLLFGIAVYFGADLLAVLAALVLSIPAVIASSVAGLLIDAARPKLDWANEQQAIKQNMNVLLHMLVGVIFALAFILPVILLPMDWLALPYLAVLAVLLCAVLIRSTRGVAKRLLAMDV